MRLGDLLVHQGAATAEQIAGAVAQQRGEEPARRLGEILVAEGVLTEQQLLRARAQQFGTEALFTVEEGMLDPGLVARLPVDWARSRCVLPVRTRDGRPAILMADATDVDAQEDLALLLGMELTPLLCPRQVILRAIEACYFRKQDTTQELLQAMRTTEAEVPRESAADDLLRIPEEAPVTQLVNLILLEALKAGASDVHIEPFENRVRVRYRIDGVLYEQSSPPKRLEAALVSRLKVMAHIDIAEKRLPQDGMARVRVGEREIDVRVSTVPVAEGERVVLRLLDRDSALLPLTALGMSADMLETFRALLRAPQGIVLITGPTGSGKTTTLYAALQELDTAHTNVLTIEDPIEYQLPGIGQIQVKPKIGLDFARGLRHVLRQDPDVILLGETRDLETAEIMIRASLTGHLVFTTLHTNDAPSAVVRLMDMGIAPYLLSAALRAVLAQRLVRRLCPQCRQPASLGEEEGRMLGPLAPRLAQAPLWRATGCAQCMGGYRGRTGLYELMVVTDEIQAAIRKGEDLHAVSRIAREDGMKTLLDRGLELALRGETSVGEILRSVGADAALRSR